MRALRHDTYHKRMEKFNHTTNETVKRHGPTPRWDTRYDRGIKGRLARARIRADLTQEELDTAIGIPRAHSKYLKWTSGWIKNNKNICYPIIERMAVVLQVQAHSLWDDRYHDALPLKNVS